MATYREADIAGPCGECRLLVINAWGRIDKTQDSLSGRRISETWFVIDARMVPRLNLVELATRQQEVKKSRFIAVAGPVAARI
ncbi:hypothetical protein GCM10028812_09840 [Ancylobacter sonchi]